MITTIPEESAVLSSWKDIARYMGKGVRTVQRWEQHLGLPVRRPTGISHKSAVLLDRVEVDAWLATRFSLRSHGKDKAARMAQFSGKAQSSLRESIRTARELRLANQTLAEQISQSARTLTEQCDLLATHSLQAPWGLTDSGVPQPIPRSRTMVSERIA